MTDNTVDENARQSETADVAAPVARDATPNDAVARADRVDNPNSDTEVDEQNLEVVRNSQPAEGPAVVTDSDNVAVAQGAEDARFRVENPDSPVARASNPEVGGE